ncbi:hypothetical protein EYF80_041115 [Liparis tanakae]|uniref:Uncharacterized protein n=1 Tax=Liparis tanakae TaxID=230148 RepID=A0A4Z2G533_9TELE|nr:hypothetical protein EYF80_041115 [Liparis tanakae]
MSMARVAWSSVADRAAVTGEKTSRTPLVRLGSNIMLRLRTLTFSQPGYRLEMLADTETPEETEAAQDATLQGLQQGALAGSGVAEQLQLDPGLGALRWPQLLDEAQLVCVLRKEPGR